MRYIVDRGVDTSIEFKGLTAQYLFIFVIGLFLDFLIIVFMIILNVRAIISSIVGIVIACLVIFYCFRMNKKYGRHGLMKKLAIPTRPMYIKFDKSIKKLLKECPKVVK